MRHVEDFLKDLGLGETEISIYLAALSMPSVTAQEAAKHTGIKRTTAYNALITLAEKGFASKVHDGGKRMAFRAVAPEMIERKIQEKIEVLETRREQFKNLLPQLQRAVPAQKGRKVVVAQYEGIDGIKTIIDEALYCRDRHWDIIAPSNNFLTELDTSYADYFIRVRKSRNITARSLWEYDGNRRMLTADELKIRNPRILPEIMHKKFSSMIILFDQKVAIISSYKEKGGVLISSLDLYATFQTLFDGLWATSEPYEQRINRTKKKG